MDRREFLKTAVAAPVAGAVPMIAAPVAIPSGMALMNGYFDGYIIFKSAWVPDGNGGGTFIQKMIPWQEFYK